MLAALSSPVRVERPAASASRRTIRCPPRSLRTTTTSLSLVVRFGAHTSPILRPYIKEPLPDLLNGRIRSARVFDWVGRLDEVADGSRAMNNREAIKVMVEVSR